MYKRTEPAPSRLAREGWIPAGPEKRVNKRAMLIPKTGDVTAHIPTLMDFSEVICPAERRALREIVETAEVVREGDHLYLLARVSAATLDSLATFETSREDLEEGADAEQVNEDESNENALEWYWASGENPMIEDEREHDFPRERQKYIKDRQQPGREYTCNGRRFVDPPTYDRTRDDEEMRKTKQHVNALAAKKRKRVKAGEARS